MLPGGALRGRPGSSELFPKGSGEPGDGFRQERDMISILESDCILLKCTISILKICI